MRTGRLLPGHGFFDGAPAIEVLSGDNGGEVLPASRLDVASLFAL